MRTTCLAIVTLTLLTINKSLAQTDKDQEKSTYDSLVSTFINGKPDSTEVRGVAKEISDKNIIVKYRKIIRDDLFPIYKASALENIEELHPIAEKKYGKMAEPVSWELIAFYYYKTKDYDRWFKYKKKIFERYPEYTSIFDLNNDAWLMFKNSSKEKQLRVALLWSKRAIESEPTANYYDTYANILYKLGRKSEAITLQKKALTLAPGNGSIDNVRKSLNLMEKGMPTWE